MISGLPREFPLEKLDEFQFGSIEARNDKLLESCFCYPSPVREFLRDEKSIVVGQKGSGKSAVFRMIKERKIWFINPDGLDQVVVPIEEDLQYRSIRSSVTNQIKGSLEDPCFRARVVWELFILYRVLLAVESKYANLPAALAQQTKNMKRVFGSDSSVSVLEFFQSAKYEVKATLEQGATGQYCPSVSGSMQPKAALPPGDDRVVESYLVDVEAVKGLLQAMLTERGSILYILIDRLDEFTTSKEYAAQKQMLQGLMECERSYGAYDRIRPKVFLRADLFRKLDFDSLGKDKVLERTVEFRWEPRDAKELMAKRLAKNYRSALGLKSIMFTVDTELLYLDEALLTPQQLFTARPDSPSTDLWSRAIRRIGRIRLLARVSSSRAARLRHDGRRTHLDDHLSLGILTCIFPTEVLHKDANGNSASMSLTKYLSSHFNLGNGATTPRIMNRFLALLFEELRVYYQRNRDEHVTVDQNGEYHLVKQVVLASAYARLQAELLDSFTMSDSKWSGWFKSLKAGRKKKYTFTFGELAALAGAGKHAEFPKFLTYLVHLGVLECVQSDADATRRRYALPLLFRAS